jgi:phosphoglycolate phosphatase-like HAD superfamily hydrolase
VKDRSILFWDFDGVIKESLEVKTAAFARLFAPFGDAVVARVCEHHERHGGMSRLEKIPLYLTWAGQPRTPAEIAHYCALFAAEVVQAVIDSPWVPGAREYLQAHCERQWFVLITATPQEEIESILAALRIATLFREVYGAPTAKAEAIARVLVGRNCRPLCALVVGDSTTDYEAAAVNGVEFLLRRTPLNTDLQHRFSGSQCDDFTQR